MTEKTNTGRKTEPKDDPFEKNLMAGLVIGNEGMSDAIGYAKRLTETVMAPNGLAVDVHDLIQYRSREFDNAVAFLKAMAEVTLAAAKLRGEFNHTYDVTRRLAKEGEGVAKS